MALSPDRRKQVETTKKRHGEDYYHKIGKKGGDNTPTKFNSDSGKRAINARWAKHRAEKSKKEKGDKS